MAAIAFPQYAKSLTLSTGHTYSYVHIPANPAPNKTGSTILFLHGFPSSSYDWRHQISFFAKKGYGVVAPDLLGYGGTSKPSSPEEYKAKKMGAEIIEILDHEKVNRVHAVSHDIGSVLLSRFANYYPERLLSSTFIAVPYSKPGEHFDLEALDEMMKVFLGSEKFGYIRFFMQKHAGQMLDDHADSFFSLFYPADADLWNDHMCPRGAMESWLQKDTQGEPAAYITTEERAMHQAIMQGCHSPALNWYHMLVHNLNQQDEIKDALSAKMECPVLILFPAPTPGQFSAADAQPHDIADDLTVKSMSIPGHWLQLEARDEVNTTLEEFFKKHMH